MEVLTNKVLRFISDTSFEDLPDKVIHQAKRCLLDTLGALLAGSDTPVARIMNSFAFFSEKMFLKKRFFNSVAYCENSHCF